MIQGQEYKNRKMQNPPIAANIKQDVKLSVVASEFKPSSFSKSAAPFKPPTAAPVPKKVEAPPPPPPKPVDKVADKLKSLDHNEDEIKEFKDITNQLKENG